jgi:cell division septation protein DedD
LVVAFVLTFTLSFALFHYKDTIASTFAAKGATGLAGFDSEISAATSSSEVSPSPRFAVQVAAYENRAQAEALARRLSPRHELVTVSPAQVNGKLHYRVRIPAETGADAEHLAATLRRELGVEAWVVYLP